MPRHESRGRPGLIGAALLLALTAIAYFPSLRGGFIFDDDWYLTDSTVIKASDGVRRFWLTGEAPDYYPVSNTTLWLEWRLWGLNATGYRVTNLLLHILAAGLLWRILDRLRIPGAFLAALLFALHPVNVESVVWIAQRKGMLAMLFFLLSICSYLEAELASLRPHAASRQRRWYAASLAAFVLAMLSKGSVAVLPLVLLGMIAWLRPLARQDFVRLVPFFLVDAVLVPVNGWFQTRATPVDAEMGTALERILTAASAVWFYLYKAIVPLNLCFVYPKWQVRPQTFVWWLPLLGIAVVSLALWRGRHGPLRPLSFAWGYYCLALLPVLGFADFGFRQYAWVADHYQHLALLVVAALSAAFWATWSERRRGDRLANAAAAAVVALFALLTWRQCGLYESAETLYRDTLAKNPHNWMVHNSLGTFLLTADRKEEAREQFREAIALQPDSVAGRNNLGFVLLQLGQAHEAVEHYAHVVKVQPNDPQSYYNLGLALVRDGRIDDAIERYRHALEMKPDYAEAHNNLGSALVEIGRAGEGREHLERALEIKPDLQEAHRNLGRARLAAGQLREATESLRRAVELDPKSSESHNDFGVALGEAGQHAQAIEQFREALRLNPANVEANANLKETLSNASNGEP